jgi:signal transduction histidine kinase/amino acid transporter
MNPERSTRAIIGAGASRRTRVIPATPAAPATVAPANPPGGVLPHPRTISWVGASALALGGSNQSLFLIGALLVAQGTMAIPLLALGLLLSYMATPGWIELSCMFPNRVGGIAATCAEAFRPYSPVLANLTGVCYWWGWVPTCGLTAIVSAQAIHQWYLPQASVKVLATLIVVIFTAVNLCGLKWAVRVAKPIAGAAFLLALCSGLIPVIFGHVDWHRALDFHLNSPFGGAFGQLTSIMTGLYLIGFAAPALEAAACHIGEMKDPATDQPKAMWLSGGMASVFFVLLPVVWLGLFSAGPLEGHLAGVIGPTFAPVLGSLAKAAAVGFVVFNMSCGTLQPLSGASRTLSQLSEDGLLPRIIGFRSQRTDAPVIAILVTALASVIFLMAGDPISLVAAANLTYLIGIALPSVAVWLLRRNEPDRARTYRARDSSIILGIVAAAVWLLATILGFAQFGLPIVTFGLALTFSGSLAYAWRALKLTGAMLLILALDAVGYLVTAKFVGSGNDARLAVLKDIFVIIGLLTLSFGLILPGIIAHSISRLEDDALDLAQGTLAHLTAASKAMAGDDVDGMGGPTTSTPLTARLDGESIMAANFTMMRNAMAQAGRAVDDAVGELTSKRGELAHLVDQRTVALVAAQREIEHARRRRLDMHERMHILSWRPSTANSQGADLASTLSEIALAVGRVLDVDVVAIYAVSMLGELAELPVLWHPERIGRENDGLLALTPDARRFLDGLTARPGTVFLPGGADVHVTPTGDDTPAFLGETGYATWLLSPVHATDGQLLALLAIGTVEPIVKWNMDDIALVDSVGADLGRAILQGRLHQRQLELVRQLRDLDQAKSEFLATFSHELRTPLTSIRAYTELLRDDEGTDGDRDRMLEVIEQNSVRLSALIEDILTLSQLNSAVNNFPMEPVDVILLVDSVFRSLAPIAQANNLTLATRTSQDSAFVLGDRNQLERLLLNLGTNAIKFTPPGGRILLSISGSTSAVVLSVSDNGIGIPAEEQAAVFGRFFRGVGTRQEVIPGSGLGLAIVQAIVEHHGGTLSLDSVPGRGTTFRIRLHSLEAARTHHELDAQAGAPPADTEAEGRMPAGVGSFRGRSDIPTPTPQSEAHTKELQS